MKSNELVWKTITLENLPAKVLCEYMMDAQKITESIAVKRFVKTKGEGVNWFSGKQDTFVVTCEVSKRCSSTITDTTTKSAELTTQSKILFEVRTVQGYTYIQCCVQPCISDDTDKKMSIFTNIIGDSVGIDESDKSREYMVDYVESVVRELDDYWMDYILQKRTDEFSNLLNGTLRQFIGVGLASIKDDLKRFYTGTPLEEFSGFTIEGLTYHFLKFGSSEGEWLLKGFTFNGLPSGYKDGNAESIFRLEFFHDETDLNNERWEYRPNPSMGKALCELNYEPVAKIVISKIQEIVKEYERIVNSKDGVTNSK